MKEFSIVEQARCWWARFNNSPPFLNQEYSRTDYTNFMKQEIFRLSPAYARGRVRIKGRKKLLSAIEQSNVIIGLLHLGSWILIGGVVRHVFGLPYTVIASRRNFAVMSDEDRSYWAKAHESIQSYYGEDFIFTDQSVFRTMSWFKRRPAVLGVAFDVREFDQALKESEIEFAGCRLWVQTGPARLAGLAKVLVVPASIHFKPESRMHELEFFDAIDPCRMESEQALIQAVFSALAPVYSANKLQGFFDLNENFSKPHEPVSSQGSHKK